MGNLIGIGRHADARMLKSMGQRLAHRGGLGEVIDLPGGGVMAGVSPGAGAQPWLFENLAMVGELDIFNVEELLSLLEAHGVKPRTAGSGDVLLAFWKTFGKERFAQVNGDFAVAVADLSDGTVHLVRDRSGTRPLYYSKIVDVWFFASEYKALMTLPELERKLNLDAMQLLHVRKVVPVGETLLSSVRQVPAQSIVKLSPDGDSSMARYWQPDRRVDERHLSEHAKRLSEKFLTAVRRRTESAGRLGISLSGGVDSIAMVAAARRVHPDATIRTYTIGDSADDPEIVMAREVADYYGTEHQEQVFSTDDLAARMKQLVWTLEDPIARTESLMTDDLCAAAAGSVDVMLRGDGADGLFGGMPRHKVLALADRLPLFAGMLTDVYTYTQSGVKPSRLASKALIKAYFRSQIPEAPVVRGSSNLSPMPITFSSRNERLNEVLWQGSAHTLPMLLQKVERQHARFGMKSLSPFLDNDLVSAAHAVPSLMKNDGRRNKIVFREAVKEFLPDRFARLPKYAQRVRETGEFCDALEAVVTTDDIVVSLKQRNVFEPEGIRLLMQRPANDIWPPEHAMRIWTLILTEYWFRQFLD